MRALLPKRVIRLAVITTLAAGSASPALAAGSGLVPAGSAASSADRAVAASAVSLSACQRSGAACDAPAAALQAAGDRLRASDLALAKLAARGGRTALSAQQAAPKLTTRGRALSWTAVRGVRSYVVARRVTGEAATYAVVTGRTQVPPAAPGKAVRFSVRTAVTGSKWAAARTISYASVTVPAATGATAGTTGTAATTTASAVATTTTPAATPAVATAPATTTGAAAPATRATDAPVLRVAGGTISWTAVGGVRDYVLRRRTAGRVDAYSVVRGTSVTPDALPGRTATYSVRSAVPLAAWSSVTLQFPAAAAPAPAPTTTTPAPTTTTPAPTTPSTPAPTTPAPTPSTPAPAPTTPAPAPAPSDEMTLGAVSGSNLVAVVPSLKRLGVKSTRAEFDIDTPAAAMAPAMEAYAKAGITPILLAGFQGRTPTAAEAANVATWAAAYGPGGTFWAGKGYAASLAPTHIEFGNEASYGYQYPQIANDPNWATTSFYRDLAMDYGRRFATAARAVRAANDDVDVLAIGDAPGNWPQWMNAIYAAVPDFSSLVGGWTVHPYGPSWRTRMDAVVANADAHGSSAPLFATEFGIATDDGRCLSDNYGWDPCMTYAQAGAALTGAVEGMEQRYGSRLAGLWLYQANDLTARGATNDRERYFGGLTVDGQAKGAFTAAIAALVG